MKTKYFIKKFNIAKASLVSTVSAFSLLAIRALFPVPLLCAESDLISLGNDVASKATEEGYNLAVAFIVPALIIIGILFFFTHNEKKISKLIGLAVTCLLAFIFIVMVKSGTITNTLISWFS